MHRSRFHSTFHSTQEEFLGCFNLKKNFFPEAIQLRWAQFWSYFLKRIKKCSGKVVRLRSKVISLIASAGTYIFLKVETPRNSSCVECYSVDGVKVNVFLTPISCIHLLSLRTFSTLQSINSLNIRFYKDKVIKLKLNLHAVFPKKREKTIFIHQNLLSLKVFPQIKFCIPSVNNIHC